MLDSNIDSLTCDTREADMHLLLQSMLLNVKNMLSYVLSHMLLSCHLFGVYNFSQSELSNGKMKKMGITDL